MKKILAFQNFLILNGLCLLVLIPTASVFFGIDSSVKGLLFEVSLITVFFVMLIRPLADLLDTWLWLRRLVILRKGFGILSSSIIVGFILASILSLKGQYFSQMVTLQYWSFENYAFFAHAGDVTGFLLLATSNIFSQRLLKQNWKRIQRLSYVYFYAGALYEACAFKSIFALYAILVITNITVLAWAIKKWKKVSSQ